MSTLSGLGSCTLFTTLLFCAALSAATFAQERYTVNRPSSMLPPPLTETETRDAPPEYVPKYDTPIPWETEYEYARQRAIHLSQKLLVYLYADGTQEIPESLAAAPLIPASRQFDREVLDDDFVRSLLSLYVLVKLPTDAKIIGDDGTEQSIHSLPGFEHMVEHPGLVVLDYSDWNAPYYGEVVGILPFLRGECPTAKQAATFLDLPPGTLTQRTLTYAVRIHPDQPLSASGEAAPIMLQLAAEHALYQAERGILTHQNFGARSARAQEILGSGMPAEICAQSRSGLGLFEGALSCMRAWRYSSAHWSIARRSHTYYGYDMIQGKNGAWYAVGFFIN